MLHLLVYYDSRPDLFTLLLDIGADPSAPTEQGYTVYDFALGKHVLYRTPDGRLVQNQTAYNPKFMAILEEYNKQHTPHVQGNWLRLTTVGKIALVATVLIGGKKLYDYWTDDTKKK